MIEFMKDEDQLCFRLLTHFCLIHFVVQEDFDYSLDMNKLFI